MSHQCSCGRDLNNNYVSYTNAYANANSSLDREASANASLSGGSKSAASSIAMATRSMTTSTGVGQTQLTAKVMFGTVGAIKELREKEKSRHGATRAGDRRN